MNTELNANLKHQLDEWRFFFHFLDTFKFLDSKTSIYKLFFIRWANGVLQGEDFLWEEKVASGQEKDRFTSSCSLVFS